MSSSPPVSLYLELWHPIGRGKTHAGHVLLIISKKRFWEVLKVLSREIDSHIRHERSLESFFRTLQSSLESSCKKGTFRWSDEDVDVDVWIEVRKHPQESKVYCSDDGRQTWSEVVKYKVGASPQYGSLQCALAEHLNLLDAEQMPASAQ
jgi:hypothetical protein